MTSPEHKSRIIPFLKGSLLWIFLFLYLIVPVAVVLLFREPEVTGLIELTPHGTTLAKVAALVWIPIIYKFGASGLILYLAVIIGVFTYEVDVRLLYKPYDESINLRGKTAVVTGSNSGIGLATAMALASMGAHVVMTCRTSEKCQPAVEQVNAAGRSNGGSASSAIFHLGSLASAYEVSQEIASKHPRVHYLFNNAGTTPRHKLTSEGLEDGFGGMHLAHMALTLGLLPSLRAAGEASEIPSRIIMTSSDIGVTSVCGFFDGEPFEESFMQGTGEGDLRGERLRGNGSTGPSMRAYGRAKLCNILFAFELNRRLASSKIPVIAHAVHTGAVATRSARRGVGSMVEGLPVPGLLYMTAHLWTPLLWRSTDEGARTLLFAAFASEPSSMLAGGQYVSALCRPYLEGTAAEKDDEMVTLKLWGSKTLTIHRTRRQALKRADERWSARLWEVSLDLLAKSPAKDLVERVP